MSGPDGLMDSATTNLKDQSAIVVQYGARHGYAVPYVLANAGRLDALYTDANAEVGIGRLAGLTAKITGIKRFDKLASRRPPPEVAARTRAFDSWAWGMERARRIADQEARVRALEAAQLAAGERMIKAGFGSATHIYSMFGEGRRFLREAKQKGLTIVSDVNVTPSAERIVRNAQARHPEWEDPVLYYGDTLSERDPNFRPMSYMLDETDIFLCPSEFVQTDLIENYGIQKSRTQVFHYPVNPKCFDFQNEASPGRILFAGTAGLRKGIHTLAEAATLLKDRGRPYDFIIAGETNEKIRAHPHSKALTFLGRIPFLEMKREFERADLVVLPSLAEGAAGVGFEAMGAGVPVVTTRESGIPIRDGLDGLQIEASNPEVLANAIESIVEDRALRDQMSGNARERAQQYSWDAFQKTLISILFAEKVTS